MKTKILMIASVLALASCSTDQKENSQQPEQKQAIRVKTIKAAPQKGAQEFYYTGTITPTTTTNLSFRLSGLVEKIYVDEGDVVKKGQKLASMEKSTFQSSYEMAKASQEQAQDAYDRLKEVHDKGSLPEIEWQEMTANLAKANAAAKLAQQNLDKCDIIAPADGVIGNRSIELGSTAIPGSSSFDLLSIDDVYVRISVPDTEVSLIKKGQEATVNITALGLKDAKAIVEKIGVVANPLSKTYEVKLKMANPDWEIKPGMACDIVLNTSSDSTKIAVPYNAVLQDDNKATFVYTVNQKTHIVSKKQVSVGQFVNNDITITQGISAGDLIVISGFQKLTDQAEVLF